MMISDCDDMATSANVIKETVLHQVIQLFAMKTFYSRSAQQPWLSIYIDILNCKRRYLTHIHAFEKKIQYDHKIVYTTYLKFHYLFRSILEFEIITSILFHKKYCTTEFCLISFQQRYILWKKSESHFMYIYFATAAFESRLKLCKYFQYWKTYAEKMHCAKKIVNMCHQCR